VAIIDKERAIQLARNTGQGAKRALVAIPGILFDMVAFLDTGEFEVTINKESGFRMHYVSSTAQAHKVASKGGESS
jgi:hypothetical protein